VLQRNKLFPLFQKCIKVLGFANLYPTRIRTAANVANGILLRTKGIARTLTSNKKSHELW
jgi:hypothetical protein